MNDSYMPSNGSEFEYFAANWCDLCQRRALDPGAKTQCKYELIAFAGEDNKQWYKINGVPKCLAFKAKKDRKRYRPKAKVDNNQIKLFGGGVMSTNCRCLKSQLKLVDVEENLYQCQACRKVYKSELVIYEDGYEHKTREASADESEKTAKYWANYYKRKLLNILAVTHRDGGEHTGDVGSDLVVK